MKKIILLLSFFLIIGCHSKDEIDVRKVEVGMSTNELKYIMGEPLRTSIENGYEEFTYNYDSNGYTMGLLVTIHNGKVYDFYSY